MKTTTFLVLLITILFAISCNNTKENSPKFTFPETSDIVGLASPAKMFTDFTVVNLEDYFSDASLVDSAFIEGEKFSRELETTKRVGIKPEILPSKLSLMKVWAKGIEYSILLKKSEKIKQKITFDPKGENIKKVQIKGEMNAWNTSNTKFSLKNGIWEAEFFAQPGKYQYIFVIDGKETLDPANSDTITNGMGGFNSLMTVGKTDAKNKPRLFTISADKNIFRCVFFSSLVCSLAIAPLIQNNRLKKINNSLLLIIFNYVCTIKV